MTGLSVNDRRELVKKETAHLVEQNDPAHRGSHFTRVECAALYMNEFLGLHQDRMLIMLTAWYHDIYTHKDRDTHHQLASDHVLNSDDKALQDLSKEERQLVADGCLHHRSSGRDPFPHLFAELMCAADREMPATARMILDRAVAWRHYHYPDWDEDVLLSDSINHVKNKFGTDGTARWPDLYLKAFQPQLLIMQRDIDAL